MTCSGSTWPRSTCASTPACDKVVGELLARASRARNTSRYLDEAAEALMLGEVLARPLLPERAHAARSLRRWRARRSGPRGGRPGQRELGPHHAPCRRYVVSCPRGVGSARGDVPRCRLAPGEVNPTLLRQLEDLDQRRRHRHRHPGCSRRCGGLGDELEVMLGYSDSGKQVGVFAAAVGLRRTQLELAAAADAAGVQLTIFHGRGGALGRGGGPGDAIRGWPRRQSARAVPGHQPGREP
ncbi:MAG: phosphoenolpyruvate carboxylase [Kofleriaceae bacterium]